MMFWIHGGAFTGGEGSDAVFDGGNLVSRGDVVVVTINYRYVRLLYTHAYAMVDQLDVSTDLVRSVSQRSMMGSRTVITVSPTRSVLPSFSTLQYTLTSCNRSQPFNGFMLTSPPLAAIPRA